MAAPAATASDRLDDASELHGVGRVGSGFHITEVVSEYRALRASVLRLWRESLPQPDLNDIDDITRFDESMDQSLARGRQQLHQARRPVAADVPRDPQPRPAQPSELHPHGRTTCLATKDDPATVEAMSMIETNTEAIMRLISDLIDFSLSGLGRAMPLNRGPVNLEELCREVVDAYRTTHPGRTLRLHSDGDITGVWDAGRLRQVVSNLMGNAIQHGSPEGPVDLSVASKDFDPGKNPPWC